MCFCTDDRCPLQGALDQHVIVIVNTKCSSEGGDTVAEDENVPFWVLKYGVKLEEILVYNSEKYGTCFVTNPAELSLEIWGK